jgi:short-subunit dehydrogenase
LDVTKESDVNAVIVQVKESGMPLIGVVSNAGVSEIGTVEFQDLDTFRWHYEVNVFGTYRLTQAALALLRQSRGRVVLTSSMAGRIPALPRFAGYVGTKYAMEAFGDALRKEMEPRGVSVSLIEPGFLKSALTDKTIQQEQELLLQQEDAVSTEQERRVYPELYNDVRQQELIKITSLPGNMNETCQAMQDALFGKYPKTRYVTARVGPFPTWLFLRLVNLHPDRVADILEKDGTRSLLLLQSVREYVERILSFVTGGK